MRVLGRLFAAAVFLLIGAMGIFYYAHFGQYAGELMGVWLYAAIAALWWVFRKEKKEGESERSPWLTKREKIVLAAFGITLLVLSVIF